MAGITDYPLRSIVREFGAGLTVSEMVSSQALVHDNLRSLTMIRTAKEESPLAVQIFGSDPGTMSRAAKIAESLGATIVDINMGCPQHKVVKSGAGADLMRNELLAARLIEGVVKAISIPVSVKIRLGWDHRSINASRIAKVAQDSGASLVTVHARTRSQMFSGKADWSAIREIKNAVSIPVIANGDIQGPKDARLCLEVSGADGIMIGRGVLGRPWIFEQILYFLKTGNDKGAPGIEDQYGVAKRHLEYLIDFYGLSRGLLLSKRHLAYYSRGLRGSAVFREALNYTKTANELKRLLICLYETQGPWRPIPNPGDSSTITGS